MSLSHAFLRLRFWAALSAATLLGTVRAAPNRSASALRAAPIRSASAAAPAAEAGSSDRGKGTTFTSGSASAKNFAAFRAIMKSLLSFGANGLATERAAFSGRASPA
eukprot:CAMPEP_0169137714 /NCGR_PEP_ID=MMETSP1015-20121227/41709_1 /TAXON_ID=342587 /ORGANISM="Karlodinium micrum, Strain CCMP2283" /LENGTH=106 /DNA_ID=CAMNT_0009202623 /DNA_START=197 /DNA_END=518 /DNA_ORIENTATION=+